MKHIRNPKGRIRSRIWIAAALLCLFVLAAGAGDGVAKTFWKESKSKSGSKATRSAYPNLRTSSTS